MTDTDPQDRRLICPPPGACPFYDLLGRPDPPSWASRWISGTSLQTSGWEGVETSIRLPLHPGWRQTDFEGEPPRTDVADIAVQIFHRGYDVLPVIELSTAMAHPEGQRSGGLGVRLRLADAEALTAVLGRACASVSGVQQRPLGG